MITKKTVSSTLSYELGLTTQESKAAVNLIFSSIADGLEAGEEIYITRFCRMAVVDKPSRIFRHSTTGKLVRSVAGKRIRCKFQDAVMKRIDPAWVYRYGHSMEDLVEPEEDCEDDWDDEPETDWKEECGLESRAAVVIDCDEIKRPSVEDYEGLIERPISSISSEEAEEDENVEVENADLDEAG